VFAPPACWDVESIEAFDVISENVTPAQVKQSVLISSDFGQHTEWLLEYLDHGWDELYLHFVGKEQSGFIDAFGEHVLPQLQGPTDVLRRPGRRRAQYAIRLHRDAGHVPVFRARRRRPNREGASAATGT